MYIKQTNTNPNTNFRPKKRRTASTIDSLEVRAAALLFFHCQFHVSKYHQAVVLLMDLFHPNKLSTGLNETPNRSPNNSVS